MSGIYLNPYYFTPTYFVSTYFASPSTSVNPVSLASSLDGVLAAGMGMLQAVGAFAPTQTWVSLDPDSLQFPLAGGPFAVFCPGAFARHEPHRIGMGRFQATMEGSFTVDVIDLSVRDIGQQDSVRLFTAGTGNSGLYALAHQVEDALDGQFIQDVDGDFLSIEPIWMVGHPIPSKYATNAGYAGLRLTFSVMYTDARS